MGSRMKMRYRKSGDQMEIVIKPQRCGEWTIGNGEQISYERNWGWTCWEPEINWTCGLRERELFPALSHFSDKVEGVTSNWDTKWKMRGKYQKESQWGHLLTGWAVGTLKVTSVRWVVDSWKCWIFDMGNDVLHTLTRKHKVQTQVALSFWVMFCRRLTCKGSL